MRTYHAPVLLKEAITHLKVKTGGKYIDATVGDGGHTLEILKLGGNVLATDQDPVAVRRFTERYEKLASKTYGKAIAVQGNYKDIDKIAAVEGFERVDGIIYDIGTSFSQLSDDQRGFAFNSRESLDMRMDPNLSVTARDLVAALSQTELTNLLSEYGGERFAGRIARAIVKARKEKPLETCLDLSELILRVVGRSKVSKIHPATRTFQALRIAVNNELEDFQSSLSRAATLLIPGGRLVLITFHSLEDRIAKRARPNLKPVFAKPITPTKEEVEVNPGSRSAKMRVYERL
ncbi:16S rRNA (cytosine(1402)-N(4))-methyltransferase RsmH [candidate division WWE3 bacterium]|nr:16S rRNA (cytosine(1402)-N(4))-methyltransferase RsmH [candidate division WWE3 bacterium]